MMVDHQTFHESITLLLKHEAQENLLPSLRNLERLLMSELANHKRNTDAGKKTDFLLFGESENVELLIKAVLKHMKKINFLTEDALKVLHTVCQFPLMRLKRSTVAAIVVHCLTLVENALLVRRMRIARLCFGCINLCDLKEYSQIFIKNQSQILQVIDSCINLQEAKHEQNDYVRDNQIRDKLINDIVIVQYMALELLTRIVKKDCIPEIEEWFAKILPLVFDRNSRLRKVAQVSIDCVRERCHNYSYMDKEYWPSLKNSIKHKYSKVLVRFLESNVSDWGDLWCLLIDILRPLIPQKENSQLINKLLLVEERAFKSANVNMRMVAFRCWKFLIKTFLDPSDEGASRRLKLLMQPLGHTNLKNSELSKMKFSVWWDLLLNVHSKMKDDVPNLINQTLTYCFGNAEDTPFILAENPEIPEKYTIVLQRMALLDILESADALTQILTLKFENNEDNFKLTCPQSPFIPQPEDFAPLAWRLIFSTAQCSVALVNSRDCSQKDKKFYLDKIWKNLLQHMQRILIHESYTNKECIKIMRKLFHVLRKLNDMADVNESIAVQCLLPVLEMLVIGEYSLPEEVLLSASYYVKDEEKVTGTASFVIMEIMFSRVFLTLQELSNIQYILFVEHFFDVTTVSPSIAFDLVEAVLKRLEEMMSSEFRTVAGSTIKSVWMCLARKMATNFIGLRRDNPEGGPEDPSLTAMITMLLIPVKNAEAFIYQQDNIYKVWKQFFAGFQGALLDHGYLVEKQMLSAVLCQKSLKFLQTQEVLTKEQLLHVTILMASTVESVNFTPEPQCSREAETHYIPCFKLFKYIVSEVEKNEDLNKVNLKIMTHIAAGFNNLFKNVPESSLLTMVLYYCLDEVVFLLNLKVEKQLYDKPVYDYFAVRLGEMWQSFLNFLGEVWIDEDTELDLHKKALALFKPLLRTSSTHRVAEVRELTQTFVDTYMESSECGDGGVKPQSLQSTLQNSPKKKSAGANVELFQKPTPVNLKECLKSRPLTKHQREKLKQRQDDIPALYMDLTQDSQDLMEMQSFDDSSQSQEPDQRRIPEPEDSGKNDTVSSFDAFFKRSLELPPRYEEEDPNIKIRKSLELQWQITLQNRTRKFIQDPVENSTRESISASSHNRKDSTRSCSKSPRSSEGETSFETNAKEVHSDQQTSIFNKGPRDYSLKYRRKSTPTFSMFGSTVEMSAEPKEAVKEAQLNASVTESCSTATKDSKRGVGDGKIPAETRKIESSDSLESSPSEKNSVPVPSTKIKEKNDTRKNIEEPNKNAKVPIKTCISKMFEGKHVVDRVRSILETANKNENENEIESKIEKHEVPSHIFLPNSEVSDKIVKDAVLLKTGNGNEKKVATTEVDSNTKKGSVISDKIVEESSLLKTGNEKTDATIELDSDTKRGSEIPDKIVEESSLLKTGNEKTDATIELDSDTKRGSEIPDKIVEESSLLKTGNGNEKTAVRTEMDSDTKNGSDKVVKESALFKTGNEKTVATIEVDNDTKHGCEILDKIVEDSSLLKTGNEKTDATIEVDSDTRKGSEVPDKIVEESSLLKTGNGNEETVATTEVDSNTKKGSDNASVSAMSSIDSQKNSRRSPRKGFEKSLSADLDVLPLNGSAIVSPARVVVKRLADEDINKSICRSLVFNTSLPRTQTEEPEVSEVLSVQNTPPSLSVTDDSAKNVLGGEETSIPVKRKRGRPRKKVIVESAEIQKKELLSNGDCEGSKNKMSKHEPAILTSQKEVVVSAISDIPPSVSNEHKKVGIPVDDPQAGNVVVNKRKGIPVKKIINISGEKASNDKYAKKRTTRHVKGEITSDSKLNKVRNNKSTVQNLQGKTIEMKQVKTAAGGKSDVSSKLKLSTGCSKTVSTVEGVDKAPSHIKPQKDHPTATYKQLRKSPKPLEEQKMSEGSNITKTALLEKSVKHEPKRAEKISMSPSPKVKQSSLLDSWILRSSPNKSEEKKGSECIGSTEVCVPKGTVTGKSLQSDKNNCKASPEKVELLRNLALVPQIKGVENKLVKISAKSDLSRSPNSDTLTEKPSCNVVDQISVQNVANDVCTEVLDEDILDTFENFIESSQNREKFSSRVTGKYRVKVPALEMEGDNFPDIAAECSEIIECEGNGTIASGVGEDDKVLNNKLETREKSPQHQAVEPVSKKRKMVTKESRIFKSTTLKSISSAAVCDRVGKLKLVNSSGVDRNVEHRNGVDLPGNVELNNHHSCAASREKKGESSVGLSDTCPSALVHESQLIKAGPLGNDILPNRERGKKRKESCPEFIKRKRRKLYTNSNGLQLDNEVAFVDSDEQSQSPDNASTSSSNKLLSALPRSKIPLAQPNRDSRANKILSESKHLEESLKISPSSSSSLAASLSFRSPSKAKLSARPAEGGTSRSILPGRAAQLLDLVMNSSDPVERTENEEEQRPDTIISVSADGQKQTSVWVRRSFDANATPERGNLKRRLPPEDSSTSSLKKCVRFVDPIVNKRLFFNRAGPESNSACKFRNKKAGRDFKKRSHPWKNDDSVKAEPESATESISECCLDSISMSEADESSEAEDSATEIMIEGVLESLRDNRGEGLVEAAAENFMKSVSDSIGESSAESMEESVAESMVESMTEIIVESIAEGVMESTVESVVEITAVDLMESTVESVVEITAVDLMESTVEGVMESTAENVMESTAENLVEHAAMESVAESMEVNVIEVDSEKSRAESTESEKDAPSMMRQGSSSQIIIPDKLHSVSIFSFTRELTVDPDEEINLLRAFLKEDITTMGELNLLSESDIARFPIKEPKMRTLEIALRDFEKNFDAQEKKKYFVKGHSNLADNGQREQTVFEFSEDNPREFIQQLKRAIDSLPPSIVDTVRDSVMSVVSTPQKNIETLQFHQAAQTDPVPTSDLGSSSVKFGKSSVADEKSALIQKYMDLVAKECKQNEVEGEEQKSAFSDSIQYFCQEVAARYQIPSSHLLSSVLSTFDHNEINRVNGMKPACESFLKHVAPTLQDLCQGIVRHSIPTASKDELLAVLKIFAASVGNILDVKEFMDFCFECVHSKVGECMKK